jgi:glyceraldehyde-3-phosphate dehydrogenase type I
MAVRVGVLREVIKREDIEIVGINDIADLNNLAYLFKYDSVHRRFNGDVKVDGNALVVNGKKVTFTQEREPENLPWKDLGADVVFEATGLFRTRDMAAKHMKAGAKKVVVSAPFKGEGDFTIVYGVNHDQYDPAKHDIISNASCTTNCFAPVVKVMNETFGIEQGLMTTAHAYTSSQKVLDLPAKDWRRGRAASLSIIPTTTGAAVATTKVFPELKGKLDAIALRAPVPDGAVVDFVCKVNKEATRLLRNTRMVSLKVFSNIRRILSCPWIL